MIFLNKKRLPHFGGRRFLYLFNVHFSIHRNYLLRIYDPGGNNNRCNGGVKFHL